ncbi:MAG: DUF4252 domain-containing protein [FCB group bacterium]|jgi:hypothetical protein
MKKQFLTLAITLILIIPAAMQAQSEAIEKLCQKYADKKGFTVVSLNKELFNMFSSDSSEQEDKNPKKEEDNTGNMMNMVKGMESMKVISCEGKTVSKEECKEFYDDVLAAVPLKEYKELLSVKDEGTNVKMLSRKYPNGKGEFIILVHENDQTTLVVINGDSNILSMESLQKLMNMKDFQGKGKSEKKKDTIKGKKGQQKEDDDDE